jgi:ribosomal protein S18 acetylase RimI-like enzyme
VEVTPRTATPDDLDGVVATLTAAFHDDPLMSWAFPDPDVRPRRLATLWRFFASELYLPGGGCATLPDHDAVSLWNRNGAPDREEFWERHGERFFEEMEGDLERSALIGAAMAEHHPHHRDHWYLLAMGVRPEAQGRGLGSILLAHTLAHLDERGDAAYLEATSPRSRRLYERFGFEVTDEFAPDGGPLLWSMWREPARPN